MLLGSRNADTGHILENIIYLELIRRGYKAVSYTHLDVYKRQDMDTMGRMINEHVNNLTELAKEYTTTEKKNAAATESLAANIISQERSAISDSYQRWHFEIEEVIMIEFKKYLPIGSVVLLKNANKRLMIYGRLQKAEDSDSVRDYIGQMCIRDRGGITWRSRIR